MRYHAVTIEERREGLGGARRQKDDAGDRPGCETGHDFVGEGLGRVGPVEHRPAEGEAFLFEQGLQVERNRFGRHMHERALLGMKLPADQREQSGTRARTDSDLAEAELSRCAGRGLADGEEGQAQGLLERLMDGERPQRVAAGDDQRLRPLEIEGDSGEELDREQRRENRLVPARGERLSLAGRIELRPGDENAASGKTCQKVWTGAGEHILAGVTAECLGVFHRAGDLDIMPFCAAWREDQAAKT